MEFTFGTDPEFMLLDENNKHKSAIGVVPGNKEKRHAMNGHEFFHDNVLAEVAIKPASSKAEAVNNIGDAIKCYAYIVDPYKIKAQAAHNYSKSQLDCEEAKEVGCDPDKCAYKMLIMDPSEIIGKFLMGSKLRSCGGHVHLGTSVTEENEVRDGKWLVRMLDLIVGVPSIFLDKDPTSKTRKKLYGQPGRYRDTNYGIEYRTPGNFWLASPTLVEIMYDLCACAIKLVDDKEHMNLWTVDEESEEFWQEDGDISNLHHCVGYDVKKLKSTISKMDTKQGVRFMEYIDKYLSHELKVRLLSEFNRQHEPDLYKEWGIK